MGHKPGRQRAQLNAFDAALLDESDRVLKIVVRVLRAVEREDSARQHWLAVDCFDDTQFIGADLDQRHLATTRLKRKLDQVQAGLEHVCLNANFAFGRDDASGRHPAPR